MEANRLYLYENALNPIRFPSLGQMELDIVEMTGGLVNLPPAGGGTLVYFGCRDCAAEASRVVANGGTIVREKMSIGEHGHIVLARDTEGNMIGFHSM